MCGLGRGFGRGLGAVAVPVHRDVLDELVHHHRVVPIVAREGDVVGERVLLVLVLLRDDGPLRTLPGLRRTIADETRALDRHGVAQRVAAPGARDERPAEHEDALLAVDRELGDELEGFARLAVVGSVVFVVERLLNDDECTAVQQHVGGAHYFRNQNVPVHV